MKRFDFSPPPNIAGKDIPSLALKSFGNLKRKINLVDELSELRKDPPNIIVAECLRNVAFTQNNFQKQEMKKRSKYIMNIGIYKQLWFDKFKRWKVLKPAGVKFNNIYRPYIGQDLNDKTILVMRTGGIGDLLFILPNLTYLKEKYPTCTIKLACGPQYHAMVENWKEIDKVTLLPFTLTELINADYHAVFEGVIERCREARKENAYRLFTKWLGLNLPDEKLIPKQNPNENRVEECKIWLEKNNLKEKDFIIIQLRASSTIRTPRPLVWKRLITTLVKNGQEVVITDTPSMSQQIDEFIKSLDPPTQKHVHNFSMFSITLDFSIALVSLSKCSVSPDSSLIHIAASMGIPAFGLYGAFTGDVRLTTYKNVDWIQGKASCAPCFIHSSTPCVKSVNGHPPCYDSINTDECVEKIMRLI